ncbi:uncharacterized protein [Musca autumnalis]|uniref:uncharacterized protein n=1 Tax=Musca autumnalis TaxID=221902 RepID=UPI003CEF91B2
MGDNKLHITNMKIKIENCDLEDYKVSPSAPFKQEDNNLDNTLLNENQEWYAIEEHTATYGNEDFEDESMITDDFDYNPVEAAYESESDDSEGKNAGINTNDRTNSRKRIKKTTSKQFRKMVELLQKNPNVAKGRSGGLGKIIVREMWSKIAQELNRLGPPTRTEDGWIKVWTDYKFKIKKKDPCKLLTPIERTVLNMLEIDRDDIYTHDSQHCTSLPQEERYNVEEPSVMNDFLEDESIGNGDDDCNPAEAAYESDSDDSDSKTTKEKKRTKYTTAKQFEEMMKILQQHPNLARGRCSCGYYKMSVKEEWNRIGKQLNAIGPPVRSGEGWYKVWSDYKFKIRKKLMQKKVMSSKEEAFIKLLQWDTTSNEDSKHKHSSSSEQCNKERINCCQKTDNLGKTNSSTPTKEEICVENSSIVKNLKNEKACSTISSTPNYLLRDEMEEQASTAFTDGPKERSSKLHLLEEQLKVQAKLYKDVRRSLNEIVKYQRKNYKLKEQKLKLYKYEMKSKARFRRELLKSKQEGIELKRRLLELEQSRIGS